MAKRKDLSFEVSFFEDLHKRLPKDVKVVSLLAHLYTQEGRIDLGLRLDRKLTRLTPEDPTAHYNLACSLALKGRKQAAVKALQQAISLGYCDFAWMSEDPDLNSLWKYPAFKALFPRRKD